jgi:shikimate kinase
MALCEKILIVGFSGAGKSTLLQHLILTAPSDWREFVDLDGLILQRENKFQALAELIEERGWDYFRWLEEETLLNWLKLPGRGVLALGGGTLTEPLWKKLEKQSLISFCHLKIPFELAWSRLNQDKKQLRPLLSLGKEQFLEIYQQRMLVLQNIPWILDGTLSVSELTTNFWKSVKGQ